MNCPFYGRHLAMIGAAPFALIDQKGNQCALITTSFSPCQREIAGQTIDWRLCQRVWAIQVPFNPIGAAE